MVPTNWVLVQVFLQNESRFGVSFPEGLIRVPVWN